MPTQATDRVCHIPCDPNLDGLNEELSRARWEVWHPKADEFLDAVRALSDRHRHADPVTAPGRRLPPGRTTPTMGRARTP
jgi:hypothetical protein